MDTPSGNAFTFTKLVVDDLEAMADYYCAVFGLHRGSRHRFERGVGGEPIDEISLVERPGEPFGSLTLLRFLERAAGRADETILGFTTRDLDGIVERVRAAGGSTISPVKEMPEQGIRVVFARDAEGHLNEIVEMRS